MIPQIHLIEYKISGHDNQILMNFFIAPYSFTYIHSFVLILDSSNEGIIIYINEYSFEKI